MSVISKSTLKTFLRPEMVPLVMGFEKTSLQGFQQSEAQTSLLSYSFACSKFRYDTFQKANNKAADHYAQAGLRLCCSQKPRRQVFSCQALIITSTNYFFTLLYHFAKQIKNLL